MGGGGAEKVKATAYEKELSNMALSELKVHQTKMAPFRDKFVADITRPTAIAENRVAGEVNANFAQMNKNAVQGDPSSGTNRSAVDTQRSGKVQGYAAVSATQAVRDNRTKGMQAGLDLVQGNATDAQLGIAGLAGQSVKDAISKEENRVARSSAIGSAVMSAAGAGASMYNNRAAAVTPKPAQQSQYSNLLVLPD
jgi:hypothetical protein